MLHFWVKFKTDFVISIPRCIKLPVQCREAIPLRSVCRLPTPQSVTAYLPVGCCPAHKHLNTDTSSNVETRHQKWCNELLYLLVLNFFLDPTVKYCYVSLTGTLFIQICSLPWVRLPMQNIGNRRVRVGSRETEAGGATASRKYQGTVIHV